MGSNVKEFDSTEAKAKIEEETRFYDDNPVKADDNCYTKLFKNVKLQVSERMIFAKADLDVGSCVRETYETLSDDIKVKSSSGRILVSFGVTCGKCDFSRFEGKSLDDLQELDIEEASVGGMDSVGHSIGNFKFSFSAKGENKSLSFVRDGVSYEASSTADGKPCTVKKSGSSQTYDGGCRNVNRRITLTDKLDGQSLETEGQEDFSKFLGRGIQSANGNNKWYKAGSMDVTINQWTGQVTYSGVDNAPKYVLKNGKNTISGTISGPTAELSLQDMEEARSAILPKMLHGMGRAWLP
jgi:hypothetical protein